MDYRCKDDIVIYPVKVEQIYDRIRAINKISSNIPMDFNLMCTCPLPKNSKIEILETNCMCSIQEIDKEISLNGKKTCNNRKCLGEEICIESKYFNLIETNCSNVIVNITEKIECKLKIKLKIKGIAYFDCCRSKYFEAEAEGVDCISTIFTSKICIPNNIDCINEVKLSFNNNIKAHVNPSYVFLSPFFDCNCNIECLLGNVFIDYEIGLNTLELIPSILNVFGYKNKIICKESCI